MYAEDLKCMVSDFTTTQLSEMEKVTAENKVLRTENVRFQDCRSIIMNTVQPQDHLQTHNSFGLFQENEEAGFSEDSSAWNVNNPKPQSSSWKVAQNHSAFIKNNYQRFR